MTEIKTILCVEDDTDSLELLQFLLESEGFQVICCTTSKKALKLAQQKKFSAIILDNWLKGSTGVDICREIRSYNQEIPIIFYSGASYQKDIEDGLNAGAQAYLLKPNDFDKITETIHRFTRAN